VRLRCDDDDCDCACHVDEDVGAELPDDVVLIYGAIDTYFQQTVRGFSHKPDLGKLLDGGLESIEDTVDGKSGDPGKLYPLHERVRRVVAALQGRIGALESRRR
jgi:hypothetical protein